LPVWCLSDVSDLIKLEREKPILTFTEDRLKLVIRFCTRITLQNPELSTSKTEKLTRAKLIAANPESTKTKQIPKTFIQFLI
jgi:hypothetical protein